MSSSISVAVRVRPFSEKERLSVNSNYDVGPTLFASDQGNASTSASPPTYTTPQPTRGPGALRKVLKVLDERILVFDPPESNAIASFQKSNLPMQGKKTKDIRFCFDRVFDEDCGQEEVYDGSARELVGHVMDGFHSTVFAYGATGCGKTHTISGSSTQPGIVFLLMKDLFARIAARSDEVDFSLTVSYLEIYNETIRDLLAPESGVLQLRDSQAGMPTPANLSAKEPSCAHDVVEWITLGNNNRTVNFTEANATSSRSHAVLRVTVTQKPKGGGMTDTSTSACLSVIDLAGSERASVTKNRGERLNEGANINRSLLALGNCINALCDPRKRGHVPYRDSKLTRLLKQSLGGNCKTVMIVCVSPSSAHYDETHNTLQYANRAKEIKTKAVRNVISVDRHVAQYCQQIMEQQQLIDALKRQLSEQTAQLAVADRADEERALQAALRPVQAKWQDLVPAREASGRAQVEEEMRQKVRSALQDWQREIRQAFASSGIPDADTTTIRIEADCDAIAADFNRILAPQFDSASSVAVEAAYSRSIELGRSQLAARPNALACFEAEVRSLDARLAASAAQARGVASVGSISMVAQLHQGAGDVLGRLLSSPGSEPPADLAARMRLAAAIDRANRVLSAPLAGSPDGLKARGLKRDLDALSSSATQLGAGLPSLSPLPTIGRARRSPQKPLASSFPPSSPDRKKVKTVQWSDDVGEDLEMIKYNSPALSSTSSTPSLPQPSPRPKTQMWTLPSTFPQGSDSSRAAELMAYKASSAMRAAGRPPPTLTAVAESPSNVSLLRDETMPPPPLPSTSSAPRSPFADLANSSHLKLDASFSMAPTSSGLIAPLVSKPAAPGNLGPPTPSFKHRRASHIGPMRSEKAMRRLSTGTRPRVSAATAGAAPPAPAPAPSAPTATGAARRPTRLTGSSSGSLGVPSLHVPPMSARKSPRKLMTRGARPSMQPTSRRLSTMPTGSAALAGMQPTAAAPTVFGGKSAARIAARRESRLSGGNTSGNSSAILADLSRGTPQPTAVPLLKKESPTATNWR